MAGFKYFDQAIGTLMPIGGRVIGFNASSPGVYGEFNKALSYHERPFTDSLKIDAASFATSLDTDGVTRIGENDSLILCGGCKTRSAGFVQFFFFYSREVLRQCSVLKLIEERDFRIICALISSFSTAAENQLI